MDTSLDLKFTEKSESIVTQLGFKDLKSFVKNQALFMLMCFWQRKIESFGNLKNLTNNPEF
ncbi:MAG: hypothetical protein KKD21_12865 [Proteobacteria bacterium]|nr:hypothetical protein [Pseudomonadota bacterium]